MSKADGSQVVSFLRSIDWPTYQGRYGLGFKEEDVKDMILHTRNKTVEHFRELLDTRCLFSASLASFILNRQDLWIHTTVDHVLDPNVVAASIEIDVNDIFDHMFVIFRNSNQWWIVQSYVNLYTARIEPINVQDLVSTIKRWMVQGVKDQEWQRFFHAPMKATNRAHPHVYVIRRFIEQDMKTAIDTVDDRIQALISSPGSYLQQEPYKTLAQE